MGSSGRCTECYRLWQQYAQAIVRQGAVEREFRLAVANGDAATAARLKRALELSRRALDDVREEVARHVAGHSSG